MFQLFFASSSCAHRKLFQQSEQQSLRRKKFTRAKCIDFYGLPFVQLWCVVWEGGSHLSGAYKKLCTSKSKKHNIKRKSRYKRQNDSIGEIRKVYTSTHITPQNWITTTVAKKLFVCMFWEKYKFMSPVREITNVFINHFNFVRNILPFFRPQIIPQCIPHWDLVLFFFAGIKYEIKLTAFWTGIGIKCGVRNF